MLTKEKIFTFLFLLGLFLSGVLIGYFIPKPLSFNSPPPMAQGAFNPDSNQGPMGPDMHRPRMGDGRMKKNFDDGRKHMRETIKMLGLEQDQKKAFFDLLKDFREENKELFDGSRQALKVKLDSLNEATDLKIKELLNDEQYKTWKSRTPRFERPFEKGIKKGR